MKAPWYARTTEWVKKFAHDAPITTTAAVVFLVGMLVLTTLFPFPMWVIWVAIGGIAVLFGVIALIINELVNRDLD